LIGKAIASYERTLLSGNSAFDQFEYNHNSVALTGSAKRGLILFRGRAGCSKCHLIGQYSALFTDEQFHISPLGLSKNVTDDLPNLSKRIFEAKGNKNTINSLIITDAKIAALGRFVVTADPKDIGKFKTPSLRNVAITAPYMHDGSIDSLEKAIDLELYNRTEGLNHPVVLTTYERSDLLAFLLSLTGTNTK